MASVSLFLPLLNIHSSFLIITKYVNSKHWTQLYTFKRYQRINFNRMSSWNCVKHSEDLYSGKWEECSSVPSWLIKHQIMACIWISYMQDSEEFFSAGDQAGNAQRGWLMKTTACPLSPRPIRKYPWQTLIACPIQAQFFHTSSLVSCIWPFLKGKINSQVTSKEKKVNFPWTLTNGGWSFQNWDQQLIVPFAVTSVFII